MHIVSRKVTVRHVEVKLTADQWDANTQGKLTWREHMASLLNLRVTKLAAQYEHAGEFYRLLSRFAKEIGFGDPKVVAKVTEKVYRCKLQFDEQQAA